MHTRIKAVDPSLCYISLSFPVIMALSPLLPKTGGGRGAPLRGSVSLVCKHACVLRDKSFVHRVLTATEDGSTPHQLWCRGEVPLGFGETTPYCLPCVLEDGSNATCSSVFLSEFSSRRRAALFTRGNTVVLRRTFITVRLIPCTF